MRSETERAETIGAAREPWRPSASGAQPSRLFSRLSSYLLSRLLSRLSSYFFASLTLLIASALAPLGFAASADAERVLVHPPHLIEGEVPMNRARLEAIHAALLRVVRDLEYFPLFESLQNKAQGEAQDRTQGETQDRAQDIELAIPPPESDEERAAIARFYEADYLIVPGIEPVEGGYLIHLEVYWAERARLERIVSDVRNSREDIRLKELLYSMVRPRGVDDSRETLEGYDSVGRTLEANQSAETRRELMGQETTKETTRDTTRDRRAAGEDPSDGEGAEDAFNGEPAANPPLPPRFVQSAIALRSLVLHDSKSPNSITGAVTLRIGRAMRRVPRLEMNAALEVGFGSAGSVALFGGGTYYFISPRAQRFRLGASFAIGLYGGTSEGISGAAFTTRAALTADIALKGPFRLQVGLPEIQYFTLSGASLNLGAYLGASARF